ncbi:hypothetical protein VNO80_06907 [Phaseolus coccineus]|uniref:Uncharacterized protein n=1 Tax=Phaseolus coccineus TaxID=3886 RepID=A0AAN9NIK5_PHACN
MYAEYKYRGIKDCPVQVSQIRDMIWLVVAVTGEDMFSNVFCVYGDFLSQSWMLELCGFGAVLCMHLPHQFWVCKRWKDLKQCNNFQELKHATNNFIYTLKNNV